MTRRSPGAFLAVCALHAVLAWALLALGSGRPSAGPAQPSPTALGVVTVSLIATLRPALAALQPAPSPALLPQRVAGVLTRSPAVTEVPAPAKAPDAPSEAPDAPGPAAQGLTANAVARPSFAAAKPSFAEVTAALAPATAPESTPTRAELTPNHLAPVLLAHADRQRCPPAPHPAALRERGIEGAVVLRVKVDAQGRPADVQVQSGSGWRLFDEAALQQVRACRFIPATQGGQAIDSWVEFPVRFALAG